MRSAFIQRPFYAAQMITGFPHLRGRWDIQHLSSLNVERQVLTYVHHSLQTRRRTRTQTLVITTHRTYTHDLLNSGGQASFMS